MNLVENIANVKAPTHISKCTGSVQHAYVISTESGDFWRGSWLNRTEDSDWHKVRELNNSLPKLPEMDSSFEGTLAKSSCTYYLVDKYIVGLEDKIKLPMPDAIYFQRITPRTKTFDMVCFYGKEYKVFSSIEKPRMRTIRSWYDKSVYTCGADPLPLKAMSKQLDTMSHERIFKELFTIPDGNESEYEPSEEDEADHEINEEDVCESEEESEPEEVYEDILEEEDYEDDEDNEEDDEEDVEEVEDNECEKEEGDDEEEDDEEYEEEEIEVGDYDDEEYEDVEPDLKKRKL